MQTHFYTFDTEQDFEQAISDGWLVAPCVGKIRTGNKPLIFRGVTGYLLFEDGEEILFDNGEQIEI